MVLHHLGFLKHSSDNRDYFNQYVCQLEDQEHKQIFKTNLFTILTAIQSINIREHYKLYDSFALLQQHILEEITLQAETSYQTSQNNTTLNTKNSGNNKGELSSQENAPTPVCQTSLLLEALFSFVTQPEPFSLNHSHLVKMHLTFMSFFLNRKDNISRGYRQTLEQQEQDRYKFSP